MPDQKKDATTTAKKDWLVMPIVIPTAALGISTIIHPHHLTDFDQSFLYDDKSASGRYIFHYHRFAYYNDKYV